MGKSILDLEPGILWKRFKELCDIPRCSGREGKVVSYLTSLAKNAGLKYKWDKKGNVVISVPASPGFEKSPVVVLQSHVDMVCEKNSDKDHDFLKDPIEPVINGEWVGANGTSLGADNGIGAAAALALIDSKEIKHGPLELLFTVDEETGLNGAAELQPDFIKGKILLNLDSEDEGKFVVGCAGGEKLQINLPVQRQSAGCKTFIEVSVYGLKGGHSGMDISTGRGNANQILARILLSLNNDFVISEFEGGTKHNAIPRESRAIICTCPEDEERIKTGLKKEFESVLSEYGKIETDAVLSITDANTETEPLTKDSSKKLLNLIIALPHGVFSMSHEIKDLVQTSDNLAIVRLLADSAEIITSVRSSVPTELSCLVKKIESVSDLAGAETIHLSGYPAWTPNLDSGLLKIMQQIHKEVTGREAEIFVIHAGLECGIIGDKFSGMEMISFGPEIQNPHSPDERVHIESVSRFWKLLTYTLNRLASG